MTSAMGYGFQGQGQAALDRNANADPSNTKASTIPRKDSLNGDGDAGNMKIDDAS
jgi:hypothetical protein